MPRLDIARTLPYPPEELFDIAADVESYPEFLPWWLAADIVGREGETYYTDQVVGLGPVTQNFSTKTVLKRPHAIEVNAVTGPFETFELLWRFDPVPVGRCRVTLTGEIELRVPLFGRLLSRMTADGAEGILGAFEARAKAQHAARI